MRNGLQQWQVLKGSRQCCSCSILPLPARSCHLPQCHTAQLPSLWTPCVTAAAKSRFMSTIFTKTFVVEKLDALPLNKGGFICRIGWKNGIACSQTKVNEVAIIIPRFQQHWEKMTDKYSYVGVGTSASSAFPANLVITTSWLINTALEFISLNHLGLPLQSSSSPKQCYCISFFFFRHILISEIQLAKEQDRGHCTAGSQKRELLLVALPELLKCSCVGSYRPAIACRNVFIPIFQDISTDTHFT